MLTLLAGVILLDADHVRRHIVYQLHRLLPDGKLRILLRELPEKMHMIGQYPDMRGVRRCDNAIGHRWVKPVMLMQRNPPKKITQKRNSSDTGLTNQPIRYKYRVGNQQRQVGDTEKINRPERLWIDNGRQITEQ